MIFNIIVWVLLVVFYKEILREYGFVLGYIVVVWLSEIKFRCVVLILKFVFIVIMRNEIVCYEKVLGEYLGF